MKKYTKGFTLIELLVVIAIIGILASVVLVSLNSARNKGKDTRIISDVQQMRTEAESKYDGSKYDAALAVNTAGVANGNGVLAGDATAQQLVTDAGTQSGVVYVITNAASPITQYAVYGALPSTGLASYFCIDSTGNTKQSTVNHATVTCQ